MHFEYVTCTMYNQALCLLQYVWSVPFVHYFLHRAHFKCVNEPMLSVSMIISSLSIATWLNSHCVCPNRMLFTASVNPALEAAHVVCNPKLSFDILVCLTNCSQQLD